MKSRKKVSFDQSYGRPPPDEGWLWCTEERLKSDAYRLAPHNVRRFLDQLELEHLRHARRENGKLMAQYDDLEKRGIGRRYIRAAIEEAAARGLVEVMEQGYRDGNKRWASLYRLTYFATYQGKIEHAPTNEWRRYKEPEKNRIQLPKLPLGPVAKLPLGDFAESEVSSQIPSGQSDTIPSGHGVHCLLKSLASSDDDKDGPAADAPPRHDQDYETWDDDQAALLPSCDP
jgi:GNAT superfamily N-acetyltransferase